MRFPSLFCLVAFLFLREYLTFYTVAMVTKEVICMVLASFRHFFGTGVLSSKTQWYFWLSKQQYCKIPKTISLKKIQDIKRRRRTSFVQGFFRHRCFTVKNTMVILVHQSNSTVKYRKSPLTERSKISNTEEQRLISLSQGSFPPYLLLQLSSRSRKSLHSGLCIQCRLTSADSLLFIKK